MDIFPFLSHRYILINNIILPKCAVICGIAQPATISILGLSKINANEHILIKSVYDVNKMRSKHKNNIPQEIQEKAVGEACWLYRAQPSWDMV
jgi:hypothetical protein